MRNWNDISDNERKLLTAEFDMMHPDLIKQYNKYIAIFFMISLVLVLIGLKVLLKNGVYDENCSVFFISSGVSFFIMFILAVFDDLNTNKYLNKFEEWLKSKNINYF